MSAPDPSVDPALVAHLAPLAALVTEGDWRSYDSVMGWFLALPDTDRDAILADLDSAASRVAPEETFLGDAGEYEADWPRITPAEARARLPKLAAHTRARDLWFEQVGPDYRLMVAQVYRALPRGESVVVPTLGTFSTRSRPAVEAVDPRTGTPVSIPGRTVPVLTTDRVFRACVDGRVSPDATPLCVALAQRLAQGPVLLPHLGLMQVSRRKGFALPGRELPARSLPVYFASGPLTDRLDEPA